MDRQCARPGCRQPAVATLSYHYGRQQVWLTPLSGERHPGVHDMCADHAAGLRVPRGWSLEDLRGPDGAYREPESLAG